MFYAGSNYLGGNPGVFNHSALNGLALGGGLYNHPSFTVNRGINYYAGANKSSGRDTYLPVAAMGGVQGLQASLNAARDEQGILGRFWDGLKNLTGIGLGSNKCQQYIDKAAVGQMSLEDAYAKISKYTMKQRGGVNLLSGLAAGTLSVVAVSAAPMTMGMSLLTGAGVGAATKAGLKTLDRATNEIDNDAMDAKKIAKDGLSGALNGAVTSGVMLKQAKHVFEVNSAKEALKQGAIQGAKCGAISGAVMGAGDYTIECGFEQDQKFSADDLITSTAYGAAAGAVLGGITGGITTKNAYLKCFPNQSGQNPNGAGSPNNNNPTGPVIDGVWRDVTPDSSSNNVQGLPSGTGSKAQPKASDTSSVIKGQNTPKSTPKTPNTPDVIYLGSGDSSNLPAVVQQNAKPYNANPDLRYLVYGQNQVKPTNLIQPSGTGASANSSQSLAPQASLDVSKPLGLPSSNQPLGLPQPKNINPMPQASGANSLPNVIYLDGPVQPTGQQVLDVNSVQVPINQPVQNPALNNPATIKGDMSTGATAKPKDGFLHNLTNFLKNKLKH